jgi:hypothetical protein
LRGLDAAARRRAHLLPSSAPVSLPLALERVVDTLVGAAVGTVAALAVRLRAD